MNIKIKKLNQEAVIPFKTHDRDFCFDCVAISKELIAEDTYSYGLGFALEFDENDPDYQMITQNGILSFDFRPRSSIYKTGMLLCTSVGTGDEPYRGEYKAMFYHVNKNCKPYEIGDKVVQVKIGFTPYTTWTQVEELSDTKRGIGGFGSTGV